MYFMQSYLNTKKSTNVFYALLLTHYYLSMMNLVYLCITMYLTIFLLLA